MAKLEAANASVNAKKRKADDPQEDAQDQKATNALTSKHQHEQPKEKGDQDNEEEEEDHEADEDEDEEDEEEEEEEEEEDDDGDEEEDEDEDEDDEEAEDEEPRHRSKKRKVTRRKDDSDDDNSDDDEDDEEVTLEADDLVGLDTADIIPRTRRRAAINAMAKPMREEDWNKPSSTTPTKMAQEDDEESDEAEF